MENLLKFLQAAFKVIIFFLGITFLYQLDYRFHKLLDTTGINITSDNLLVEVIPQDKEHYITRNELIAYLMDELDFDMEIIDPTGTYSIDCKNYSPALLGLYSFTGERYEKLYHYNLNGEISKIIFRYI